MSSAQEEPKSEKQPRKKRGGGFVRFLVKMVLLAWLGIVLVAVAGGVVAYVVYDYVTQDGVEGPAVLVEIPNGATGVDVGRLLKEAGLIDHEALFALALRLDEVKKPLQSGQFELSRGLSPLQLVHRIQEGPNRLLEVDQYKLTVPEGLTIAQMAELFEDPNAFIAAATDPDLIKRVGVEAATLEGFLMPNTYFFDRAPEPREAVERMLTQFERDYARLVQQVPRAAEFDKLMIVTVASLVEEEAKVDEERPLVAAVIYNRLDDEMLLGMDSTLQYATGKYG
ncbi:MAG: endolytic transglycosylase MltG, partial [Candidatus Hydrogenedentes bacterium]|nr:endolytic transglycosylase MltG [Candidatus Hydrogenedentota bacterium]